MSPFQLSAEGTAHITQHSAPCNVTLGPGTSTTRLRALGLAAGARSNMNKGLRSAVYVLQPARAANTESTCSAAITARRRNSSSSMRVPNRRRRSARVGKSGSWVISFARGRSRIETISATSSGTSSRSALTRSARRRLCASHWGPDAQRHTWPLANTAAKTGPLCSPSLASRGAHSNTLRTLQTGSRTIREVDCKFRTQFHRHPGPVRW
jgi:hypothetical protein